MKRMSSMELCSLCSLETVAQQSFYTPFHTNSNETHVINGIELISTLNNLVTCEQGLNEGSRSCQHTKLCTVRTAGIPQECSAVVCVPYYPEIRS